MKEMWRIVKYSKVLWRYYVGIACFVVVLSVLALATPFLIKGLIDGLTKQLTGTQVPFSHFAWILLGLLVVNVVTTLLSNINGYLRRLRKIGWNKNFFHNTGIK